MGEISIMINEGIAYIAHLLYVLASGIFIWMVHIVLRLSLLILNKFLVYIDTQEITSLKLGLDNIYVFSINKLNFLF